MEKKTRKDRSKRFLAGVLAASLVATGTFVDVPGLELLKPISASANSTWSAEALENMFSECSRQEKPCELYVGDVITMSSGGEIMLDMESVASSDSGDVSYTLPCDCIVMMVKLGEGGRYFVALEKAPARYAYNELNQGTALSRGDIITLPTTDTGYDTVRFKLYDYVTGNELGYSYYGAPDIAVPYDCEFYSSGDLVDEELDGGQIRPIYLTNFDLTAATRIGSCNAWVDSSDHSVSVSIGGADVLPTNAYTVKFGTDDSVDPTTATGLIDTYPTEDGTWYAFAIANSNSGYTGYTKSIWFSVDNSEPAPARVDVTSVSLYVTSVTLFEYEGGCLLEATVSPDDATDKTVVWSSSNTDVATVDDEGYVSPFSAGTATITVTATNGTETTADDKTATCIITVDPFEPPIEPDPMDPEGPYEPEFYTVTYSDDKADSGSVPNDTNSYIQGEPVTVFGAGDLTRSGYRFVGWESNYDGQYYNEGDTFDMPGEPVNLTAVWEAIYASGAVIKDADNNEVEEISLAIGGTKQLKVDPDVENALVEEQAWESGDSSIATVSNGLVTAIAPGMTTITGTIYWNNRTDFEDDEVIVWVDPNTAYKVSEITYVGEGQLPFTVTTRTFSSEDVQEYTYLEFPLGKLIDNYNFWYYDGDTYNLLPVDDDETGIKSYGNGYIFDNRYAAEGIIVAPKKFTSSFFKTYSVKNMTGAWAEGYTDVVTDFENDYDSEESKYVYWKNKKTEVVKFIVSGNALSLTDTYENELSFMKEFTETDWLCADETVRDFITFLWNKAPDNEDESGYEHVYYFDYGEQDPVSGVLTQYKEKVISLSVKESTPDSKQFDTLILDDKDSTVIATLTSGTAFYGEQVSADVEWKEGYKPDGEAKIKALDATNVEISYSYAIVGAVGANGSVHGEGGVVSVSEYYDSFALLCDKKGIDTVEELYSTKYSVKATINYQYKGNQKNVSLNTFFNYVKKDLSLVMAVTDECVINPIEGLTKTFDGTEYRPNIILSETNPNNAFGLEPALGEKSLEELFGTNDYTGPKYYKVVGENETLVNSITDAGSYIIRFTAAENSNYKGKFDIPVTITKAELPTLTLKGANKLAEDKVTYGTPVTKSDFTIDGFGALKATDNVPILVEYYFTNDAGVTITKSQKFDKNGQFIADGSDTDAELNEALAGLKSVGSKTVTVRIYSENYNMPDIIYAYHFKELNYRFNIERKRLDVTLPEIFTITYGDRFGKNALNAFCEGITIEGFVGDDGTAEVEGEYGSNCEEFLTDLVIPSGVNVKVKNDSSEIFLSDINTSDGKILPVGTYAFKYYDTGCCEKYEYDEYHADEWEGGWTVADEYTAGGYKALDNYYFYVKDGSIGGEETEEDHDSVLTIVPKSISNFAGITSEYRTVEVELTRVTEYTIYVDGNLVYNTTLETQPTVTGITVTKLGDVATLIFTNDGVYKITVNALGNFTGSVEAVIDTEADDETEYVFVVDNAQIEEDYEHDFDGKTLGQIAQVMLPDGEDAGTEPDALPNTTTVNYTYSKNTGTEADPVWTTVPESKTMNVGQYKIDAVIKAEGKRQVTDIMYVTVVPAVVEVTILSATSFYGEAFDPATDITYTVAETTVPVAYINKALKYVKFYIANCHSGEVTEYAPNEVNSYYIVGEVTTFDTNINISFVDKYGVTQGRIVGGRYAPNGNYQCPLLTIAKKNIATAGITYKVSDKTVDPITWATPDGENAIEYTDGFDLAAAFTAEYLPDGADEAVSIKDEIEIQWVKRTVDTSVTGYDYISFYLAADKTSRYYTGKTPLIKVNFHVTADTIQNAIQAAIENALDLGITGASASAGKVKFTATKQTINGSYNVKTFGVKVIYVNGTTITDATDDENKESIRQLFLFDECNGVANTKTPATTTTYNVTAPGSKGTWGIAYAVVEYKGKDYTVYSAPVYKKAEASEEKFVCEMATATFDTSIQKLKFEYISHIPSAYKTIKVGIIAVSNNKLSDISNIDNDLTLFSNIPEFIKVEETNAPKFKFPWTKKGITDSVIWYVRGYTVYEDSSGYRYVIYSDIVAATKTSTIKITDTFRNGEYGYISSIGPNVTTPSKMSMESKIVIPENAVGNTVGVIATINKTKADAGLTINTETSTNETYVKAEAITNSSTKRIKYPWSKKEAIGQTWYIRPYVIYTLNGNSVTVYFDTIEYTME